MTEFLGDWATRAYLAYLVEEAGKDPTKVFMLDTSAELLLSNFRNQELKKVAPDIEYNRKDENWNLRIKQIGEDDFAVALMFHCLLSKVLMKFNTLVASSDGRIIEPDDYLFVHMDRLDWVYPSWPIRKSGGMSGYYHLFDTEKFSGGSIAERYCFLDFFVGTIGLKVNSIPNFRISSHFGADKIADRYVKTQVDPFLGWSVVWNDDYLPDDYTQFFEDIGLLEDRWQVPDLLSSEVETNKPTKKRGAKPAQAKEEYFRRYPNGRTDGLSADAVAAELSESGFRITGRSIINYEKERKDK